MGKFDGILICTDLDGTLYRNDKSVSAENKEAIAYFKREGGSFTFITGRMPYYSKHAYQAAEPNVPFGCVNGAGVYDGVAQAYVWRYGLGSDVWPMLEHVDRAVPGVGMQVCTFDHTYFLKENRTMERFREVTGLPHLVCQNRGVSAPIAKIVFGSDFEEDILALERCLHQHPMADQFSYVRSSRTLFEILPKGAHKGLALAKLTEYLQLDAQKTIAIGDYDNDVGMFEVAGLGIAVANASKAALAAADAVTVSNEQHAIARVIADLEKGCYKGFCGA